MFEVKGCLRCMRWPCLCGVRSVPHQLRMAREAGGKVAVSNPKRHGRVHYFDVAPRGIQVWDLDTSDQSIKSTTKAAGMEVTAINGVPVDEIKRGRPYKEKALMPVSKRAQKNVVRDGVNHVYG